MSTVGNTAGIWGNLMSTVGRVAESGTNRWVDSFFSERDARRRERETVVDDAMRGRLNGSGAANPSLAGQNGNSVDRLFDRPQNSMPTNVMDGVIPTRFTPVSIAVIAILAVIAWKLLRK